jgi:hypothetical protein
MAGFDPDVFGSSGGPGFDADVFTAPAAPAFNPPVASQAQQQQPQPKLSDLREFGMGKINSLDGTPALAGAVRGAVSIGDTLLTPVDWVAKKLGVQNSFLGRDDRRQATDQFMQDRGIDPNSTPYKTGKIAAEVAGTSGVGGAVANTLRKIPGVAQALPTLLPAIESGGMSVNGARGAYGAVNRVAGGAVNGGLTAGLVDPNEAGTGMLFGSMFPPAAKVVGYAGQKLGGALGSKPINQTLLNTARESVDAGYVIPPNMVKPGLGAQVLESISGKQATQQIASTKNNEVTEGLVRKALGLPDDAQLTQATLEGLRKTAGRAYSDVAALSPQAAADLEALKQARNDAAAWFKSYNRSASPADLAKAKQFRADADNLENWLEFHAAQAGRQELIPALRDARKEIAKTYTVGRALNDASGTVDARVLGRMHEKGMPLSDGLDTVGKFGSAFPSVAKSTQQVGSPAAHNLKSFGALLTGAGGFAAGGPLGLAAAAIPFVAPAAARSIMFSGPAQRSLVAPRTQGGLLTDMADQLLLPSYRGSGLLATYGQ